MKDNKSEPDEIITLEELNQRLKDGTPEGFTPVELKGANNVHIYNIKLEGEPYDRRTKS